MDKINSVDDSMMNVQDNLEGETSTSQNLATQVVALLSDGDFIKVLADKIKDQLIPNSTQGVTNDGTDHSEITSITSRSAQLPNFSIPAIDVEDKLKGHNNYRSWKQRVERDLIALGRHDFIRFALGGEKQEFTHQEKRMYDAQVRQYLEATLQNGPRSLIVNETTAADAFQKLEDMFGKNDIQKMVELLDNFGKIVLHPKMNPMAFITKFENAVRQFQELGVPLDKKIVVAYFLHKVRHLRTFSGFYATMATLPENTRTYEFVRNTFLDVAGNNYSLEMENSKYSKVSVDIVCSECNDNLDYSNKAVENDIITVCSLCLDFPKEINSENDAFVSVCCLNGSKCSIDLCDFCVGSRLEGSSSEPPRKGRS